MKLKMWVMIASVLVLALLIGIYFVIQKENEEERLLRSSLYHWVNAEYQDYVSVSKQLEAVLASGRPSNTLDYLNDVEETAGAGVTGTDLLRQVGVKGVYVSGIRIYEPYRYIDYLVDTWNGDPLTDTEWCRRQVEFYTFCSFPLYTSAENMLFLFFIR